MTLEKILELFPHAKINAENNTISIGQLIIPIAELKGRS